MVGPCSAGVLRPAVTAERARMTQGDPRLPCGWARKIRATTFATVRARLCIRWDEQLRRYSGDEFCALVQSYW